MWYVWSQEISWEKSIILNKIILAIVPQILALKYALNNILMHLDFIHTNNYNFI